jgi:hypothetical protein
MLTTSILDIVITLIFLYFILAVIISAFNEILMSTFNIRGRDLKDAIENLLFDDNWKKISSKILEDPFIEVFRKKKGKDPAFISSSSFVSAFINSSEKVLQLGKGEFKSLNVTANETLKDTPTGRFLQDIVEDTRYDLDKAKKKVEDLFNQRMVALTTEYKKKVQYIIFGIGLALAAAMNIDTINIVDYLWKNPVVAEAASLQVATTMKHDSTMFAAYIKNISDTSKQNKENITAHFDSLLSKVTFITAADSVLKSLPLPLGWAEKNYPHNTDCWNGFLAWLAKIAGILMTAIAITLGAPFWFDLLNKMIAVKKPASETGNK